MYRGTPALLILFLLGQTAAWADVDVSLEHTDRVYDAATDRVFCLTGGSITPVNPATGALEVPIVVTTTSSLSRMALSATGSQLFVSHDNNKRLAQVDLAARTIVADWSADTDANGAKTFFSFAALPGMQQRVVTATLSYFSSAISYEVYETGVRVASSAQQSGAFWLAPGNLDGEWFALDASSSSPIQMYRGQITGTTIGPMHSLGTFPSANYQFSR